VVALLGKPTEDVQITENTNILHSEKLDFECVIVFENIQDSLVTDEQLRTIFECWDNLPSEIKRKIKKRKLLIKIDSYASNSEVGMSRMKDVKKMLLHIIGSDENDESLAAYSLEFIESKKSEIHIRAMVDD
jgi:hypothetical protein